MLMRSATAARRGAIAPAFWLTLLLVGGTLMLAGCNTVAGIGEDTQAAGDAIEDTAEDAAN